MKKKLLVSLVSLVIGLFMGGMITSALAISLDVTLIDGDWSNATPTSGITIVNSGNTGAESYGSEF